ncbi:hypothetical protein OESDEN_08487 [Oesophagostomum dentatum]|uniref:DDE Tnp4 domain-containing protein n=1 Tax=Oesophagostomum dentatum TaxID=61180 RepID=A0A0B1T6B8_OESDE|nr:hypothetical protein OESDEN_08487 [Oesophagostomum dentatum]
MGYLANVLEALNALDDLLDVMERDETREYVKKEHLPFLDTRFRTFDEYFASKTPDSFLYYTRLYPNEFEDLLVLRKDAFPPITTESMMGTAIKSQQRYDYPRAVGFMDGQHVALKAYFDANDNVFPEIHPLPNVGEVHYHILVDGGFGMSHRYIRPYAESVNR